MYIKGKCLDLMSIDVDLSSTSDPMNMNYEGRVAIITIIAICLVNKLLLIFR